MNRRTGLTRKVRAFPILPIISVVVILIALGFWFHQDSSGNSETDEVLLQPTPTASVSQVPRSVKLEAIVPATLTDEQLWYQSVVEKVLDDPERWVGKAPLQFSDNDRAIFLSLILTESSFQQFDETGETVDSGIDCDGLAQLCDIQEVCDPSLRWDPFENVYCGASYFKSLVSKWDGDYAMALAEYKGASNELPNGDKVPNPEHPAVRSVFAIVAIR